MWIYEKRLEFPVNIKEPNAKMAMFIMSQYGGPDGEMGASMRYLSQRFTMPNRKAMGILNDIGTEELAHLEMVSTIVHQLTRGLSPEEIQASATGEYEEVGGMMIDTGTGKDKYQTDPVPEGKPIPVEPEDVEIGDAEYTCTLSISCATILDNMDLCNKEKRELVPEDGWILKPMTVTFYEGESVFNILQRTCKQQKIHMEFENTPIYNSAYIEGINNLYEFDVGNTSGWMYKVNGWFPNYGCSRYAVQAGDVIEWMYTCDLGSDVGGGGVSQGYEE